MRQDNQNKLIFFLVAVIAVQFLFLIASCQRRSREAPPQKVKKAETAKPAVAIEGKIAIVLDDWGYNLNSIGILKEIEEPLTLAILPNLPYSKDISRVAIQQNKEVLLHLPLEPRERYRLEKNTIFVDMPQEKIITILKDDFASVPGLKGVSNHMGSKATEDVRLMEFLFVEFKKRGLYFLDSYTSKTICREAAASLQLPYAQRNVFLDNENAPEQIRTQLEAAVKAAKRRGSAIAIGHARVNTLEVLKEAIPQLKKRGFKFVYVSELVK